ncbi:glycoside hydrolase family protein [Mucilaginibacter sp.]
MKTLYIAALALVIFCQMISPKISAQQFKYLDGRPTATLRINCKDAGIVLKHGNGPDSCDTYGAREANVVKVRHKYYLFYDGAGKYGWQSCLAVSTDLIHWQKKGAILKLGDSTHSDYKSASSPWIIKSKGVWHMFYLGTPHTTPAPDRIPGFPYLTMKAQSKSVEGPWVKQYNVHPFKVHEKSFYTITSSPGFIIKKKGEFLQFFSGASQDSIHTWRTLGLARTKNLDSTWTIDPKPLFPPTEQVENSSLYYDKKTQIWYLFTNHIGITKENGEYTDAIWVYWTKDIYNWNEQDKAIVLDTTNCSWAKGTIGMPAVIKVGKKLALLYDGVTGTSTSHMGRDIGLAWIELPVNIK